MPDSARDQITIRANDLRIDDRWPLFSRRAADLGVRSILSFLAVRKRRRVGALNLYAREPSRFDDYDETIGLLFASPRRCRPGRGAAASSRRSALQDRDLIGQAKGVLMERYQIDAQHAFAILAVDAGEKSRNTLPYHDASGSARPLSRVNPKF